MGRAATIPDRRRWIECAQCHYQGPALEAHQGYRLWHFLTLLFGVGLLILVILGNLTTRTCPQCKSTRKLNRYQGDATDDAIQLWRAAHAQDQQLFKQNQLKTMLALFALLGVLVLVMWRVYG